ncbi:uncharacterized protein [Dermacentor albipictus]|uniref:uncharacterized protein isoform X2 n=1 Tax=Dermacentor albipictus TaxID=60249 RepID=UPI0038FC3B25
MKGEGTPSTSRDGTQGASSTLGAYRTIADDALRKQGNTEHTPMTDETCNVDGAPDNGNRSCQPLGSIRSIDNVRPSTSRAGMEEASANFEDGGTISESTMVHQEKTQYQLAESTSTVFGHTNMTETESTGLRLPFYSSSSSIGDYAVASTSRTGAEKAPDTSGNDARNATATGGMEQQEYGGVRACDQSSVKKLNHKYAGAPEAPKQPWLKKATVDTRLLHLPSATKQCRAQARNSSRALHGLPTVALRFVTTPLKTCGTR